MKNTLFTQAPSTLFRRFKSTACYLFGSQKEGKAKKESDYDIAIFVKDKRTIDYRESVREVARSFLYPEKLHLTIVDLVRSSPNLLYQIIKRGTLLYESSPGMHIHLESLIMRLYFDDQYRNIIYYRSLKNAYAR